MTVRWTIRRPVPGDGERLRALRLQALVEAREAFLETPERAAALDPAQWEARVARCRIPGRQVLVVAEVGQCWVGMVGAFVDEECDSPGMALPVEAGRSWACLWGMYIKPAYRSSGLAAALCAEVYSWAVAEAAVDVLGLSVRVSNARAIAFYRREGFRDTNDHLCPEPGVSSLVMLRPVTAD